MSELQRKILFIWSIFTFLAIISALNLMMLFTRISESISFLQVLAHTLVDWYTWALLTPLIVYLTQRYPVRAERWPVDMGMNIALALFMIFMKSLIDAVQGFWFPLKPFNKDSFGEQLTDTLFSPRLFMTFLIYTLIVCAIYAFRFYHKFREKELAAAQLESQLAQVQLQVLKVQIQPHFLFNTLNAISSLVYSDPKGADQMISNLSDLLRYTLKNIGVQEIPLVEEIDLVKRYLAIEQVRFQDRLEVRYEIDPASLDARVPTMILQPLVENSIRHGIAKRSKPGRILVRTEQNNGSLRLLVQDNGPGFSAQTMGREEQGIGLNNTRQRLQKLYGDTQSLCFWKTESGETAVRIELPYRKAEP